MTTAVGAAPACNAAPGRAGPAGSGPRATIATCPSRLQAAADPRPADVLAEVREGRIDLPTVAATAAGCRACDLWARATQTVFGQGPVPARWMLVGEQPGDNEDIEGAPFVGPAGRILDEALEAAEIDRESVFITNVVKHFKWRPTPGSKRRLHERPNRVEIGSVPAVARVGARARTAGGARAPWCDRCAGARGRRRACHARPRPSARVATRAARHRDDPSLGRPAFARSSRTRRCAGRDDRGPSNRGSPRLRKSPSRRRARRRFLRFGILGRLVRTRRLREGPHVYQWFVFIHLVGLVLFVFAHGASAFVTFQIRTLRDPAVVSDYLSLSQQAVRAAYVGLLLLLVGGAGAATVSGLWAQPWVWTSVVVLILVVVAMYAVGSRYYIGLRRLLANEGRRATGHPRRARRLPRLAGSGHPRRRRGSRACGPHRAHGPEAGLTPRGCLSARGANHLVGAPASGHALELVLTAVLEGEARTADQLVRGARHVDLAAARQAHDPRRDVNGQPADIAG